MTLSEVETRVLNFLGTDSADPPIPQASLWMMINEAYVEYIPRFTYSWSKSLIAAPTNTPSFIMGEDQDGQWIECETLEAWDGATTDPDTGLPVYTPLRRETSGQILFMGRSEGAIGRPRAYSLDLQSRTLNATRSRFLVRVYPIPDAFYTYRARIRGWPTSLIFFTEDLLTGTDVLQFMDDEQGDQLATWVSIRVGALLGYPRYLLEELSKTLPDQVKSEVLISQEMAWTFGNPRGVEDV